MVLFDTSVTYEPVFKDIATTFKKTITFNHYFPLAKTIFFKTL